MSDKLLERIAAREQKKIRPEPPKSKKSKRPEPAERESGLGTVTTSDLPGANG